MTTILNDLVTCDVGQLTYGLRDNAKDICEMWHRMPFRREDFGEMEMHQIRETVLGLQLLLREIDKKSTLMKVAHG